MNAFPAPCALALAHQQRLLTHLNEIYHLKKNGFSFAEFMRIALYEPGLGYYSAGLHKFGAAGDFVTAPEISPLFSQCLGVQCAQILKQLSADPVYVLELGAGSGKMAADLIQYLSQHDSLPTQYWIMEVSADLKERQQHYLRTHCPSYFDSILWLEILPTQPFMGIILANEVLDAMPVHLFQIGRDQEILEGQLCKKNDHFELIFDKVITPSLTHAIQTLQHTLPHTLELGYTSEINLGLAPWLASLSACIEQGVLLFLDYGFPRQEYYHPSRTTGTLMCHYRHYAHSDPLHYIGLQDITAHVDFTAVALAAKQCGLAVSGFIHQAAFLLSNGILSLAQTNGSDVQRLQQSSQLQKLIQPHEMGELCKAIALSKHFSHPLQGFELMDHQYKL